MSGMENCLEEQFFLLSTFLLLNLGENIPDSLVYLTPSFTRLQE